MEVRDVHHAYRQRVVLRGIDIRLRAGTLCGIVGENGAVVLNDALTVRQHLTFFQRAYRLADLRCAEQVMDVLGFAEYADERAAVLSGGTRQKLNVTLALMHDPQVLLLDEPYQGFDWDTYQRFWELAARLRDTGRSVLVVSHLAYDTERLDELWRLDDGLLRPDQAVAA
ncbi:ATP-binding cassette domain-containing protein [Streptomyces sviceus]|uniref:ATP-binding cassette domain-containing protein n=1 Tax=Streptomyces sviceus TaxID=285530 RepID=UPI0036E28052